MSGLLFTSCAKNVKTPEESQNLTSVNATAREKNETGGVKAIKAEATVTYNENSRDGVTGWVLKVNQFEYIVPENLSAEYQREGLLLNIVYEFTDKQVPCNCEEKRFYANLIEVERVYREQ